MDEAAARDLERWRGGIDEGIKNLARSIDQLREEFKDEREAARVHRDSLRSVIGANSNSIATLSSDVNDLKEIKPTVQALGKDITTLSSDVKDIKRIEPTVIALEASHNKAKGVVWLARAMWGVVAIMLGAVLAKFGWK